MVRAVALPSGGRRLGGAAGRLVGVEVGLEGQQQLAELLALVGVEGGEQLVLGGVLGLGGGGQVSGAGGAEGDDVAAAVGGVALAGHVPVGLQRVEQGHEHAWVHPHALTQFLLARRSLVVEKAEEVELAGAELVGGVGVPESAHGRLAQQGQQEPGAGPALLDEAAGRLVAGCHPDNVALSNVGSVRSLMTI
jgi:hypothetical protein